MKKSKYKRVFLIVILINIVFCPFGLEGQDSNSKTALFADKIETLTQSPAREFSPYQADASDQSNNQFPVQRIFQTEFTIQNTGASYNNQTTLWCYVPSNNGYNQVVPKVSTTEDARLFADSHDNYFLRFDIKDIPPYATRIVRVDCEVLKGTKPFESLEDDKDRLKDYLLPEPLLEADHKEIIDLSKKLAQKDPYETAKKIFDWVTSNIAYSGFDKQDKGALHGLTYKEGDCTEQAAIFTALCRASGIPAKLIWGYRCPGNCQGTERLHTWSEFHANDAWRLVDITNHVFDKEIENYIGLENYHAADSNPLKNKHRYNMEFTFEDTKTRIDIKSEVRLH